MDGSSGRRWNKAFQIGRMDNAFAVCTPIPFWREIMMLCD